MTDPAPVITVANDEFAGLCQDRAEAHELINSIDEGGIQISVGEVYRDVDSRRAAHAELEKLLREGK